MVLLNSTTAFLIGITRMTLLMNTEAQKLEWIQGPKLNFGREGHSCARIRKDSSSLQFTVIVVGGWGDTSATKSVEIFDEEQNEWRNGPDLPLGIYDASIVEDPAGGVVLVGGYSAERSTLDTLFRLSDAGDDAQWVEMPQKLKTGKNKFISFMVPDDVASCSII